MNIQDRKQRVSIWVRGAAMAVAICIYTNSLTYAQDFEAVKRRLFGAVKAGELSVEQAKTMMAALERSKEANGAAQRKKSTDQGASQADMKRRYLQAAKEIKQAVEAGKISKEQAQEKLNSLKKEIAGGQKQRKKSTDQGDSQADMKRRYLQAAEEIKQAVEAGKISREDAKEKVLQLRKELFPNTK